MYQNVDHLQSAWNINYINMAAEFGMEGIAGG
jgi:hypothetical protein